MATIQINRAPVMTLWAVVVAERLGHSHEESLTLGRAVAGLNAYSKAKAIGLISTAEEKPEKKPSREKAAEVPRTVDLLGRRVPVTKTKTGWRALSKDAPVEPSSVERYLASKFKDALPAFREAMERLAASIPPKELEHAAYGLYEKFRPKIPPGEAGWGKAGTLTTDSIDGLISHRVW